MQPLDWTLVSIKLKSEEKILYKYKYKTNKKLLKRKM